MTYTFYKERVNEQWLMGRLSRFFDRCSRVEKVVLNCKHGVGTLAVTETMGYVPVKELVFKQVAALSEYFV